MGAHGANRTGRVFTGDSSGDWLFRALHKAGFANQPHAREREDGLRLLDCAITGAVHCAPPDNMPSREERENCRPWLDETIDLLPVKVLVALGGLAWQETVRQIRRREWHSGRTPKFGHGAKVKLTGGGPALAEPVAPEALLDEPAVAPERLLLGCYHPSRQNTNTGRLTEAMLDAVFAEARRLLS